MITFRWGSAERRYGSRGEGQIRLTAPSGGPGRRIGIRSPGLPWRVICVRTHAHGAHSGRGRESKEQPSGIISLPPSYPPAPLHTETAKGKDGRQEQAAWGDGEVHAQVQGGGRRGGRRGGHAGRRRPDAVPRGRGQRRRLQAEEAAAARLAVGLVGPRSHPGRELLPEAAEPHVVHGPAGARIGCWPRARAGAAAPGRPLALLQHGLVRGRVGRGAGQEPAVVRLRRCCIQQGRRPGGLGEQQRGERRQPREARDDAVQPFPRRPERPGVGSGGAEQRPVIAAANAGRPGSACREVEGPAGGRGRGVLRGRRGGRGQALRLQVQLRRGPRRAPRLRPVRVDPGGEQQLAISKPGSAWACKGGERSRS
ncbi:hypothetical protein ACQJBY_057892 [Aegilops geniculata]